MWCNCTVIVRELLLHATTWLNLTKYYEVEEEDHEFGDSLGYIASLVLKQKKKKDKKNYAKCQKSDT
jgi:hypothetical protein